jgi:hypothetical protein
MTTRDAATVRHTNGTVLQRTRTDFPDSLTAGGRGKGRPVGACTLMTRPARWMNGRGRPPL